MRSDWLRLRFHGVFGVYTKIAVLWIVLSGKAGVTVFSTNHRTCTSQFMQEPAAKFALRRQSLCDKHIALTDRVSVATKARIHKMDTCQLVQLEPAQPMGRDVHVHPGEFFIWASRCWGIGWKYIHICIVASSSKPQSLSIESLALPAS